MCSSDLILLPFMLLVTLSYYFGAETLIGAFMKNEAIITYGANFLQGFCLGMLFLCTDFLAVGVFQAIGLGKAALVFAVLRKIALEIPALYVLNYFFPLYGLAYAQTAAELVLAVIAVVMLVWIFGRLQKRGRL